MVQARWVRATLIWDVLTGAWAGEQWQSGLSMVDQDSGGVLNGAIRETCPEFAADVVGVHETPSGYGADYAWKGEEKFTAANQVSIANALGAFVTATKAYIPTSVSLTEIRFAAFDSAGATINGSNVFTLTTPIAGTGSGAGLPRQVAAVLSLRTGARGPAGRGRMFLPYCAATPATDGLIGSSTASTTLTAAQTLMAAIRTVGPAPAVVNRAGVTFSGISSVAMGNHFDVQRRRVNAIDETYTSLPTP